MFNGLTQDERMAGNFREKNRAIDVAQTALDSAGFFLSQSGNTYIGPNNWAAGITCDAIGFAGPSTTPIVCNAPLNNPETLPWIYYSTYNPPGMTVAASGKNTYSSNVIVYTNFLGQSSANPPAALYQVTAAAKGGNDTATAVVKQVFRVTANSVDLGGG